MIRFIHSSDLHLGKPFGRFPEDVRARLRQARADVLPTLARLARENNASHILLAGDTFDQTTPAPNTIRQALNMMGSAAHVTWVVMPGNHDHANATELWRQVQQDAPPNLALQLTPAPYALSPGATLLPAPPTERHPGRDLTEWFDAAPTGEALRIGLAHGAVTSFDSADQGGSSIIAPDRAARAGLAYLGLGDWHGALQIAPQSFYSGTPEADSFKHDKPPTVLLVEIAAATAAQITPLPSASLHWHSPRLHLSDPLTDAPETAHAALLPPLARRAQTMLDLTITGRIGPIARAALQAAIAQTAPDFLWHRADLSGLGMIHDTSDLDAIDQQGALRAAAQTLAHEAADPTVSPEARATAAAALSHLFALALEE